MAHAEIQPNEYEEITTLFRGILRDFDFPPHESAAQLQVEPEDLYATSARAAATALMDHLSQRGIGAA
jgi:hypothetical protein